MFGSVVIDVVIAMALVFFVFSLVTSGLREVVAWLLNTRAKVLWQSVRELLDDPISNGMQPLHAAIAQQPSGVGENNSVKANAAERALRVARDEEESPQDWATAVDATVSSLRSELDDIAGLDDALTKTQTQLKKAYAKPNPALATAGLFWRRKGEGRPRSPVVPTIGNVTVIAQSVHDGVRSFTDAVYDHPLVRQLDKTVPGRRSKLTWLDSGDFSEAALDLIQAAGVDRLIEAAWAEAVTDVAAATSGSNDDIATALRTSLHEVKGRIVAGTANAGIVNATFTRLTTRFIAEVDTDENEKAVADALEGLRGQFLKMANTAQPVDLIEQGLEALENIGPVRDTVARATAAARGAHDDAVKQMTEISATVGMWYDGRMESLTVWYRKRSRFVGFLLALLVVLGFNVDAVDIPRDLWQNEAIRSALVAVAEASELDLAKCTNENPGKDVTECVEDVEAVVDQLIDTGLPVGWIAADECNGECSNPLETLWHSSGADDSVGSGLLKLAGWMLAAAALSMGASFWFDIMRRAMGIKAATKSDDDS